MIARGAGELPATTVATSAKTNPVVPLAFLGALAVVFLCFPPFHIVPLKAPATTVATAAQPATFDPAAAAAKIWQNELPAASSRATDVTTLATVLRASVDTARAKHAKSSGLGAAYFFLRGSGKVIARERNVLRIALDGAAAETIAIKLGPVFGNTVRDGCGLLDVNNFPGLQEFNALSAELNSLVEKTVLPTLRDKAVVGTSVEFVGCAEAPESAPDAGEPMLTIVPIRAAIH